jgi:hypothetical protein
MKTLGLFSSAAFAVMVIGGLTPQEAVRVQGVVLDPQGDPVRAAQVMATTQCGLMTLDRVGTAETDDHGKFALKIVPEHCGSVMLQASKRDDLWLWTGQWEDVLENPGTAPVIDLRATDDEPIEIHLGSRGAELTVETTDEDDTFWPSILFVNRCGSGGSEQSQGMSVISADSPIAAHLLPAGSYCVGVVSANGMFPLASTCTQVELVAGQRSHLRLLIDPLQLTTELVRPVRGCSGK